MECARYARTLELKEASSKLDDAKSLLERMAENLKAESDRCSALTAEVETLRANEEALRAELSRGSIEKDKLRRATAACKDLAEQQLALETKVNFLDAE